MRVLKLKNISLNADDGCPVLKDVSLDVRPGERVALMGANGSGKSSLLRVACGLRAALGGSVDVDGISVDWTDPSSLRRCRQFVGLVGQDPDDQMVASSLFEEVAFGPCNLGLDPADVRARVAEALERCGLVGLDKREVATLSGGERQRAAFAGVVAMRPRYLLLDEPTSMLDPRARTGTLDVVDDLAGSGCGIVHVTHRLDDVIAYDRVIVLDAGSIAWEGTPIGLLTDESAFTRSRCTCSRWLNAASALVAEGLLPSDAPFQSARQCVGMLGEEGCSRLRELLSEPGFDAHSGLGSRSEDVLAALHLGFSYAASEPALRDVSLALRPGEVALVLGATGSGKSTLLQLLAGLAEPSVGDVLVRGGASSPREVGVSFQRASDQLFASSALDDVCFGPRNLGHSQAEALCLAQEALALVGMSADAFGTRSPFALSGGQARRVALAGVLAMGTPIVALDEPTVGLDADGIRDLLGVVRSLARRGVGVVLVTHDAEVFEDVATTAYVLCAGSVVLQGPAGDVLSNVGALEACGLAASQAHMAMCLLDNPGDGVS